MLITQTFHPWIPLKCLNEYYLFLEVFYWPLLFFLSLLSALLLIKFSFQMILWWALHEERFQNGNLSRFFYSRNSLLFCENFTSCRQSFYTSIIYWPYNISGSLIVLDTFEVRFITSVSCSSNSFGQLSFIYTFNLLEFIIPFFFFSNVDSTSAFWKTHSMG